MNARRAIRIVLPVVLSVSVVGGWALSRSSDDVDADLTEPGVVQTPGIGTNPKVVGKKLEFREVEDVATGVRMTIRPTGVPMVVNFWFSTCEPCKREMPELSAAAAKYDGRVQFVGINPNDSRESAQSFIDKYDVGFSVYLDNEGDMVTAVGLTTFPGTYFLDGAGNIVATKYGELKPGEIDTILRDELGVDA